jgi:hypothetical protein
MILLGASGVEAEIEFRLLNDSTGAAITDKGDGGNPWNVASAGLTDELLVNLPGVGTFANCTIARIVNKGRGFYAYQLSTSESATAGKAYIDHAVSGVSAWGQSEVIIDPADFAAGIIDGFAIENTHTLGDLVRLMVAVLAGKVTDYTTNTHAYKSLDGSVTRVTFTTDTTGRLTVTIGDLT